MRRMSFALTTEQVKNQSKTVTRRNGWLFLKPGDQIQPVVKCMGLKKGEKQELINGPIEVLKVAREPLNTITPEDVLKEGFPNLSPAEFVEMYCKTNRCPSDEVVTRIEYKYI